MAKKKNLTMPRARTETPDTRNTTRPVTRSIRERNTAENKTVVSIVIPSAPDRSFNEIAENLRRVRPDGVIFQLLIVKGTWPPVQRNIAIRKAGGDFIFLFDDDIIVKKGTIEKVLEEFAHQPEIEVIGGPNLTPPENGFLQHCFGFAHGSWFTAGKTSARYSPARETLSADEDILISCNLAFRAKTLKTNPFDPYVFPNEENDLLGRMSAKGVRMMYTPEFWVYHHRRRTFKAYLKQIFNWGKGRMRRTLSKPESFSPAFFVPLAFLFYLISLLTYNPIWYLAPLGLYLALDLGFSAVAAFKGKNPVYLPAMFFIFPLTHVFYALGLLTGLYPRRPKGEKVRIPRESEMHLIEITIS